MSLAQKAILVTILLSAISVVADMLLKKAGDVSHPIANRYFVLGFLVYSSTAFGWVYVFKYLKFSLVGVFYCIPTVLFLTMAGVFYYKDKLNVMEFVGIALAVSSIVLLRKFA